MNFHEWNPLELHNTEDRNYVTIFLNRPIGKLFEKTVLSLWKNANLRIAVDGGANHTYNLFGNMGNEYNPNIVSGDFDSIRPDVLQHYKKNDVSIINTPDQNETDFTKAVRIAEEENKGGKKRILAICTNGGRMDHVMGNLNTLFLAGAITPIPVFLLSDETVSWLLPKGKHKIYSSQELIGTNCGLIPIGEPCLFCSTKGLKWNLDNGKLKFGELISTSNEIESSAEIEIENSSDLLWTMDLKFSV